MLLQPMTEHQNAFLRAPYADWAAEKIYSYFCNRELVQYFPVVDVIETERRKIDAILENRFEFNHETYQLLPNFDWKTNPSRDEEWLILLHKFYYAVGFGLYFQETQDRRYLSKWVELTSSWINSVEPSFLSSDVTGRRVQNWIFAHYYFATTSPKPILFPSFYLKFLESIHRQVNHLRNNLTARRNHRTLELYAIFLAAVVFPEMQGADEWLEFSKRELFKNMQEDLLPDGVQCEQSTDYHHIVLRNYLGVRRLAHLNNIAMPAGTDELIRQALEFTKYCHKPDGCIPALSDGDTGDFRYLLEQGYELYGDEEMLYVVTKGQKGKAPASRSKAFNASGYYILRSGWGEKERYEDERYLIFDCGPLGQGNHGHLDLLSFEMAAYGQSLIVDPARYTYDESGAINWRARFRGTGYHNTVLVDGLNQTKYVFKSKKGKYWIAGAEPEHEFKAFVSRDGFDYLHGIARSREYDAMHERKILFATPEYWIVADHLRAEHDHDYDLLFHLSEKALGKVDVCCTNDGLFVDSPNLVLAQPRDANIAAHVENGFVSPIYGVKHEAPIIRFAQRQTNASFYTVLYPYHSARPEILVEKLPVFCDGRFCADSEAVALQITIVKNGQRFTDLYFTSSCEQKVEYHFADMSCDRALMFVRHVS